MADFYDELVTYFKAQSSITDEVGAGTAARIFPDVPKQGTAMPFIVLAEADGGESFQHQGGITGVCESVWHVFAYADDRTEANDLSETIRLAGPLQGFKGTMGSTAVQGVLALNHRSAGIDQAQDRRDHHRYWNRRVYRIFHSEPTS